MPKGGHGVISVALQDSSAFPQPEHRAAQLCLQKLRLDLISIQKSPVSCLIAQIDKSR